MSNYFDASGTIGFTCDNCGRELQGCTWVNGMRFCAKCYQETFGNTTSQYVDMLNKEMYELKIATLEKQLADTEAQNKRVLEKLELIVRSNQELEKALELACLVISKAMCPNGDWETLKIDFANAYKEQAQKELKSE